MDNFFTIADGLEITGALKKDGSAPASVYKGRRTGELLSAVKLLPKPDLSNAGRNEQLQYIRHELSKLKKLGEAPHPNVVRIINAGISPVGDQPFIEMELVEGPDLATIIQQPGHSIFTIRETLKIAEQLSNALHHCHDMEVINGGIKSSNIKLNRNTGNYVMMGFGLAVMPVEQRLAGIRNFSDVEFAAPEQHDGELLYQTDVYRFGLMLYKLLTGSFPSFPKVHISAAGNKNASLHPGAPFPDLLSIRKNKIPPSWPEDDKEQEKLAPEWLVGLIYKCLDKDPENRFANGIELHEYITMNIREDERQSKHRSHDADALRRENNKLQQEVEKLEKALEKEQFNDRIMYQQWKESNESVLQKDRELELLKKRLSRPSVTIPALCGLLLAAICLGAASFYFLFSGKPDNQETPKQITTAAHTDTTAQQYTRKSEQPPAVAVIPGKRVRKDSSRYQQKDAAKERLQVRDRNKQYAQEPTADTDTYTINPPAIPAAVNYKSLGEYKVRSKAYFHDQPDEKTRRNAFIVHWNKATLQALDDRNGFIYVVFTNYLGQTSKGWINKADLIKINL